MGREHAAGKFKLNGADRKSRHLYDLSAIFGTDTGKSALADRDLAERVRVAFGAPDDAIPGALKVVPPEEILPRLRADYNEGTARMIFGDPPTFDEVIERVGQLQDDMNGSAKPASVNHASETGAVAVTT